MSKKYIIAVIISAILFWWLFLILSINNRLASDDYYFIWDVQTNGIFKSVCSQYLYWCGRYSATLFMDIFYILLGTNQTYYFIITALSYIILLLGLIFLIKNILTILNIQIRSIEIYILSFSFSSMLFFTTSETGEVWFWYCSLSSYLWSIIAIIYATAYLLYHKIIISLTVSSLLFIYIGGSSEIYSSLYFLLLIISLAVIYKNKSYLSEFIKNKYVKKILFVSTVFFIAFTVFLIAPGNFVRDELFPKHEISKAAIITIKSLIKFLILYLPSKFIYIIVFSTPFLIIGKHISKTKSFFLPRHFIRKITILYTFLLLTFFYITAFIMSETGPARIWFFCSFLTSIYSSLLFFSLGHNNFISFNKTRAIETISIIMIFFIMSITLISQLTSSKKYALAVDNRIEYLLNLKQTIKNDTLIYLKPLPPSGMLYSAEITADTNHFTNKELKLGYNLNFHVAVEKP